MDELREHEDRAVQIRIFSPPQVARSESKNPMAWGLSRPCFDKRGTNDLIQQYRGLKRVSLKLCRYSINLKKLLGAPHTGQSQSSGISSQRVPGGMPLSGSPFASS